MTRRRVPIAQLPTHIRVEEAVEAACAQDIELIVAALSRRASVFVECDKALNLYLFLALRARFRRDKEVQLALIDGRHRGEGPDRGAIGNMLIQLTEAIRGETSRRVLVLPHLDLLTTSSGQLIAEAREALPLLYENPEVVLLGFRDPSLPVPRALEALFATRRVISGIPRAALPQLITQREARAIEAEGFDPFGLYKYVSGLNPVRCRQLLEQLAYRREAPPGRPNARRIYRLLRDQTQPGEAEIPSVDLDKDVAGYAEVKRRLKEEILDLIALKDTRDEAAEVEEIEALIPRGVILYGPPGTGKTFIAKAMATALDATIHVVSGPELKSKWVGESEENLRAVFRKARASAPALIVFDEIDAFAQHRERETGSGVEHSMVNQLLTEMDGFRANEQILIIGTTNLLSSVDVALLRPGRFEFLIPIPAPDAEERRAILDLYDARFKLGLDEPTRRYIVRRTAGETAEGMPYTGDHLYAIARGLKRRALRGGGALGVEDVERALSRHAGRRIKLCAEEERVVAHHEAGHALLAILLPEATPPERISIAADGGDSLGYVLRAARAKPYTLTAAALRAEICVGLGGYAAEHAFLGAPSIGALADLRQATEIAHAMVVHYGMSDLGPMSETAAPISEARAAQIDMETRRIIDEALSEALLVLKANAGMYQALVAQLIRDKVIDAAALEVKHG